MLRKVYRVNKSRRMRWAGNVECILEMREAFKILVGKAKKKGRFENLDADGRIILKWMLKRNGCEDTDWYLSDSGYGPVAGSCEHGTEPSGYIKVEKFLYHLSEY
jgi:hypothetical protein